MKLVAKQCNENDLPYNEIAIYVRSSSKVGNPNSRKCVPAKLEKSEIREIKLLRKFHATWYFRVNVTSDSEE